MPASGARFNAEIHLKATGFGTAGKQVARTGEQVDRATRRSAAGTARLERTLSRLKRVVLTLGLGLIAVQAVRVATEFDASVTRINTLVGVARQQVQGWRGDLIALAGDVGRGPNELARALFVVTSAGERGAEALEVVAKAGRASAAGLGDTATIARTTTAALQAYKESGLTAAQATDVLVATVREGNLEAESLAGSLGRVLGIAAETGVSFAEVGGFVATFTRLGVGAEEAVTALRGTLNLLFKSGKDGQKALQAVGLSMDEVRASIREKGLAQTLVDLVAAFGDNQELLARFVPNVRALSGVLGTAGAQAQQFLEIEKSVVESTGDLDRAFEGVRDTPTQIFARLRASIEGVAIAIGEGVASALADGANDIQQWLVDNRDAVREWGQTLGEAIRVAVAGLQVLLEHLELVKVAVLTLIALKLASWLLASAAASRLAAVAMLDLRTAVWAVTSGYAKLVGMELVSKLKAISVSTAGLAAGAVALALALNAVVDAWKESIDVERQAIIESSKLARTWSQLNQAVQKGEVPEDLFKELQAGAEKSRKELEGLQKELARLKAEDRGGIVGNVLDVAKIEKQIAAKQEDIRVTEIWIERAKDMVVAAEEAAGDGGGGGGGGGSGLSALREATIRSKLELIDHKVAVLEEIRTLKDLEEAAGKGARELDLLTRAHELGITAAQLQDKELRALLTTLRNMEELDLAIAGQLEADLQEGIVNTELPPVELDVEGAAASMDEWLESTLPGKIEEAGKQLDELVSKQRAEKLQQVYNNFLQGLQRQFASTFQSIFSGTFKGWEDLWDGVKQLALQTLAEVASAWLTQQFALNITGSATGSGGGGFLSSLFGGGGGGASAVSAGAWAGLGAAIAFAAIVALDAAADRHKFSAPISYGISGGEEQVNTGLNSAAPAVLDSVRQVVDAIEDITGGLVETLPEIAVKIRNDGETVRVYLRGELIGWFKTVEEALDFAISQAFQEADMSGVAAEIQQVLRAGAGSVEELLANVELVQSQLDAGLPETQRNVREFLREMERVTERFNELGVSTNVVVDNTIRGLQELRDQIVGITRNEFDQRLEDARGFNTELASYRERLEADLRRLYAQLEIAAAAQQRLAALGEGATRATLRLAGSLPQLTAQIEAIERELALLPAPIDPAEIRPRGGGGGGRRQQREQLEEELRGIVRSGLPDFQRSVAETLAHISDLQERVAKLGADGQLAQQAIEVLSQQLREQFQEALAESLHTITGWPERLSALQERFSDLRAANEAHLEQTGELIEARWKVNLAERRAMEQLGREVVSSLGVTSFETEQQLRATAQSLNFLRANFEALGLTAEQVGQITAQVQNQIFTGMVEGLLRWTDNEDARRQLEEIRFRMEMHNYRLQLEVIRELGLLTQAQLDLVQGLINDAEQAYEAGELPFQNPPPPPPPPPPPAFNPAASNPANERLENALRLLEQYESSASTSDLDRLRQIREDFEEIFEVLGRGPRELAAYEQAVADFWDQFIDPLRQLQEQLTGVGGGGESTRAQLDSLYSQAQQLLRDASSSDEATRLAALQQLPGVLQNLLSVGEDVLTGAGFLSLRQFVLAALSQITGEPVPGLTNTPALPGAGPSLPGGLSLDNLLIAGGRFAPGQQDSELLAEVRGLRQDVQDLTGVSREQRDLDSQRLGVDVARLEEERDLRRVREHSSSQSAQLDYLTAAGGGDR